jgi:hypothetical protein
MNSHSDADEITAKSLAIIGEYTTSGGPMFDDHFLVVVYRNTRWVRYPMGEAHPVIARLEQVTGTKLAFALSNVTTESSRILFPSELKGRPLLDFYSTTRGLAKLLKRIRNYGVDTISVKLTEEVLTYFTAIP